MLLLALILGMSLLVGLLGINSRLGFWGNFFASVLLTPLVGLLLVIASSPKKPNDC
ncbi:hypothetical protein [Desulfovibrio sp. UIB00]|uniref:hypothetical protein n=1 Tax=Desulfovibrio sp. UIB00 TaxID=2804314 RepID=UPI001F1040B7|nr:hypothetical protein [Desulfovibrio sp. UIB00]MCH5144541.1 hypothetical protein [Desulfovibrio sp. UIB00]